MKTKMSAAQREARREAGLSTTNPTHACSGALRTPNQTAKRSVTRISDPKRKMKGNELDPDTQLEKLMGWMAPAPTGVAMRHSAGV